MKFMVMHKNDENTEAGKLPPPELIAAMGALVGGAAARGILLDGDGLGPSKTRARITFAGGQRSVLHGPYAGSNELPAGVVKVKVQSRDEAIAWATKIGEAIGGDLEIEVGQINEAWDIGMGEKPANAPLRCLILHKATQASEAGSVPQLAAVLDELRASGVLISSTMLTPSSRGKRLTARAGKRQVVDGPFAESKELIGGYAVLEMATMDECVAFCWKYAEILLMATNELEMDVRPL